MNILFTGGSSFTGYWFIKELVETGNRVWATFTKDEAGGYSGVRKQRVVQLLDICNPVFDCRFGDEKFVSLIGEEPEWDLLCHHAADVTNYKSPDFDIYSAVKNNTKNLTGVLEAFRERGCNRVLLTGSVFENDEGLGSENLIAFSPYGLSKGLTYQIFRYYCFRTGFHLGKFVIPNPFGPYEEKRFTHYLINTWAQGGTTTVRTPDYIRDNIHIGLLAKSYQAFMQLVTSTDKMLSRLNPSGYVGSQGGFVRRFAAEMKKRLGLECEYEFARQTKFAEPKERTNTEPATDLVEDWDEKKAWDELADYYRKEYLSSS